MLDLALVAVYHRDLARALEGVESSSDSGAGNILGLTRFPEPNPVCYRVLFDARATNSSNLESKSFRMGDSFDFL
jgi:hypothetical protein